MDELNFYYHIVPTDDGYTYLCQEKNTGELYLHKKTSGDNPEALIFSSGQAAEEWIKLTRLPESHFEAQYFGTMDIITKFDDVRG